SSDRRTASSFFRIASTEATIFSFKEAIIDFFLPILSYASPSRAYDLFSSVSYFSMREFELPSACTTKGLDERYSKGRCYYRQINQKTSEIIRSLLQAASIKASLKTKSLTAGS